jgi:hypothetical protein
MIAEARTNDDRDPGQDKSQNDKPGVAAAAVLRPGTK